MLILPKRYENKLFVPVPDLEWREPSSAAEKDELGNPGVVVKFRLEARLHDGFVRWRGIFKSYEDFDAFSWSLARYLVDGIPIPREDWHLPSPAWDPGIGPEVAYAADTLVYLTGSPGTTLSYTSPSNWGNNNNDIWTLAGGGGGAFANGSTVPTNASGGAGGAWNGVSNFAFAIPGTSATPYQIGNGGAAGATAGNGSLNNGTIGGDTWFGGSTIGASSCGSKGGAPGLCGSSVSALGGVGANGVGTSSFNGGNGGTTPGSAVGVATGGGGAAGPNGAGGNASGTNNVTGGTGDSGTGGTAGNAGTEWGDGAHGSGGGATGNGATPGTAGLYGAAGAGCSTFQDNSLSKAASAGRLGQIRIRFGPAKVAGFNIPMMGL